MWIIQYTIIFLTVCALLSCLAYGLVLPFSARAGGRIVAAGACLGVVGFLTLGLFALHGVAAIPSLSAVAPNPEGLDDYFSIAYGLLIGALIGICGWALFLSRRRTPARACLSAALVMTGSYGLYGFALTGWPLWINGAAMGILLAVLSGVLWESRYSS